MMFYFFIGVGLILSGGIIAEIFPARIKAPTLSFFTALGAIVISVISFNVILTNEVLIWTINFSPVIGEVYFVVDQLSAFFIIFISLMSFIGTIFTIGYIKKYLNGKRNFTFHFLSLSILIVSMIFVVTIQNALAFLIVWELMTLSSFMLVTFENEAQEVIDAGINYLIFMHIGVVFLISGFIFLSLKSGSFNFNSFKAVLESDKNLINLVFLFFFIGFGTKAGFVPFHSWLPKTHPAAPGHISAIMSGVMIKTGIYGILRILFIIKNPTIEISIFIIFISIITAFTGISYAVYEKDIKRILAYSSVENIGLIGLAIGVGCMGLVYNNYFMAILGLAGALMHIFNHSLFKMLLFFGAGYIHQKTHTRNIEKLGGLVKFLPKTAMFFLIGSIAICGLPPLNGFISEVLMFFGMLEGVKTNSVVLYLFSLLSIAVLALIGSMTIIGFSRIYSIVFSGHLRSNIEMKDRKENKSILLSFFIISLLIFCIGIYPIPILKFVFNTVSGFINIENDFSEKFTGVFFKISAVSFIFIAGSAVVFILRTLILKIKPGKITAFKTWDCGYQGTNSKMQYTASSYSDGFVKLIRPFIKIKSRTEIPEDLFLKKSSYKSVSIDRFEEYIIKPFIKVINLFFNLFSIIQSRNVKHYLIYVMIYIVIIIALIIGIK